MRNKLKLLLLSFVIIALIAPAAVLTVGTYNYKIIATSPGRIFHVIPNFLSDDFSRLLFAQRPLAVTIGYLNRRLGPKDRVLLFRRGEVWLYNKVNTMSCFSPKLANAYKCKNPSEMRDALLAIGINYIYVPPYYDPLITATTFNNLLVRPELVERVFYCSGHTVYHIKDKADSATRANLGPSTLTYSHHGENNNTDAAAIKLDIQEYGLHSGWTKREDNQLERVNGEPEITSDINGNHHSMLYTGFGPLGLSPNFCGSDQIKLKRNTNYMITGVISGLGVVQMLATDYYDNGMANANLLLWDGTIHSDNNQCKSIYSTGSKETYLRISFSLRSRGKLRIDKLIISEIGRDASNQLKQERIPPIAVSYADILSWPLLPYGTVYFNTSQKAVSWLSARYNFDEDGEANIFTTNGAKFPIDGSKRIKFILSGHGFAELSVVQPKKSSSIVVFLTGENKDYYLNLVEDLSWKNLVVSVTPLSNANSLLSPYKNTDYGRANTIKVNSVESQVFHSDATVKVNKMFAGWKTTHFINNPTIINIIK